MTDAKERADKRLQDRRIRLASQRTSLSQSTEENPTRTASVLSQQNDTRVAMTMFGRSINRPLAVDLIKSGTQGMIYFSTDTKVLSAWTSTAWVTVTLS